MFEIPEKPFRETVYICCKLKIFREIVFYYWFYYNKFKSTLGANQKIRDSYILSFEKISYSRAKNQQNLLNFLISNLCESWIVSTVYPQFLLTNYRSNLPLHANKSKHCAQIDWLIKSLTFNRLSAWYQSVIISNLGNSAKSNASMTLNNISYRQNLIYGIERIDWL